MTYKALSQFVTLENLTEGDIIEAPAYIEKLRFFEKYALFGANNQYKHKGTYVVDRRYREPSEIGLHYYKYSTLIKYLSKYRSSKLKVCFDENYKLYFETIH